MRAAALCAITLLLAIVVSPPVLAASVWLAALHDAGHVLVFAAIGALLCVLMEPRGVPRLVLFFVVIAVLAVGSELAQPYASMGDVGRDLLGASIGVLAWSGWRRRRRTPWILAAILLAIGLAPLAFTGWAYAQRALHPEVVWDAGRATWRVFLEPPVAGGYARHAAGLRFTATDDAYAGVSIREPPHDWRGYDTLRIAIGNPGPTPIRVNVRIDDRPRDTAYEDRFNRERTVPAGAAVAWRIALADIERGPQGRRLDLSRIERVVVFLSTGSRGAAFDLAGVRLERAP
ncbi:MAG: hypothetical protein AB7P31_03170 [Steroidobacteraceae bacterium]